MITVDEVVTARDRTPPLSAPIQTEAENYPSYEDRLPRFDSPRLRARDAIACLPQLSLEDDIGVEEFIREVREVRALCCEQTVLLKMIKFGKITVNSPTSTKRPGCNTQHLYLNQYMPPRRRIGIRCNFQTTSSTISQKPPEENLRDQVESKKGGMSQIKFLFSTCYARCDGPCEIPHSLDVKNYPLLTLTLNRPKETP
ncbi:uncharacterized protein [Bombus fervidus]|uniref:uncharacterized protein n=1 Tax=Bombus fervidus TaxID=203811 RepID=UPI003D189675